MRDALRIFALTGSLAACATVQTDSRPEPILTADALMGASIGESERMLGRAAAFERREGTALLRRYALGACELLVILRADERGAMHVTHADASSGSGAAEVDACLEAAGVTWSGSADVAGETTPPSTQTER